MYLSFKIAPPGCFTKHLPTRWTCVADSCIGCTASTGSHIVHRQDIPASFTRLSATPCTGEPKLWLHRPLCLASAMQGIGDSPASFKRQPPMVIPICTGHIFEPEAATAIPCTGGISLTSMRHYTTLATSEACRDILPVHGMGPVQLLATPPMNY